MVFIKGKQGVKITQARPRIVVNRLANNLLDMVRVDVI